jgi:hypothetical protein
MTGVRLTAFRVSLLSTLSVVLLYVWASQTTLGRNLEAKALDLRFHLRGVKQPGTPVILVAIDDRSIAELGRWPWSRRHFAAIVQRLHAAGAKVVAFDLLFTEPEAGVEQALLSRARRALEAFAKPLQAPEREAFEHIVRQMEESSGPDAALASAMRAAGNVVLPFAMTAGYTSLQPQSAHPVPPPSSPKPPIASCRIWVLSNRRWHFAAERSWRRSIP